MKYTVTKRCGKDAKLCLNGKEVGNASTAEEYFFDCLVAVKRFLANMDIELDLSPDGNSIEIRKIGN
jgi:hypothetical protein